MVDSVAMLFLSLLTIYLVRRMFRAAIGRRRRSGGSVADRDKTCPCGCDLTRLQVPHCPACGRVAYFDATAEQLGLSDDELARIAEAQRRRRQG